jgi:hypothetical protein
MGRRQDDPRPPIEVLGADLGVSSTQQVAIGGGGPKRGRGRALAVAALVVVVLTGGLLLGGSGDDENATREERDNRERTDLDKPQTSTSRRVTTTTRRATTTTTIPRGPIFGEPVGGWLVTYDPSNDEWTAVDVDTGERTELDLPIEDPWTVRAVPGGLVAIGGRDTVGSAAMRFELDGGERPEGIRLGSADTIITTGDPDAIWLVDGAGAFFEPGPAGDPSQVRLVDRDGEVLRAFEMTPTYGAFGLEDGIVFGRGGQIYLANEDGTESLGFGFVLAGVGDQLVVESCDAEARCGVELRSLDGDDAVELVAKSDRGDESATAWAGPDGQIALTTDYDMLLLFDPGGDLVAEISDPSLFYGVEPAWLPGDRGIVINTEGNVRWLRPRDGELFAEYAPGLRRLGGELLLYVPPAR